MKHSIIVTLFCFFPLLSASVAVGQEAAVQQEEAQSYRELMRDRTQMRDLSRSNDLTNALRGYEDNPSWRDRYIPRRRLVLPTLNDTEKQTLESIQAMMRSCPACRDVIVGGTGGTVGGTTGCPTIAPRTTCELFPERCPNSGGN